MERAKKGARYSSVTAPLAHVTPYQLLVQQSPIPQLLVLLQLLPPVALYRSIRTTHWLTSVGVRAGIGGADRSAYEWGAGRRTGLRQWRLEHPRAMPNDARGDHAGGAAVRLAVRRVHLVQRRVEAAGERLRAAGEEHAERRRAQPSLLCLQPR